MGKRGERSERIKIKCKVCPVEFLVTKNRFEKENIKYCSKLCKDKDSLLERIEIECKQCNKKFKISISYYNKGDGKFCSQLCFYKYIDRKEKFICINCGREFITQKSQVNTKKPICSWECRYDKKYRIGKGLLWGDYVLIYLPEHPYCTKSGHIVEQRLVMEKFLGRYLTPDELVHHIDENKLNNKIENLLMVSISEHNTIHNELRKLKRRIK